MEAPAKSQIKHLSWYMISVTETSRTQRRLRTLKIQQCRQSYTSFRCPFCKGIAYTVRQTADEHNDRQCRLFHHRLKTAAYAFGGVSACAEPHAESERIVFAPFLRVYDTFSLFLRCFRLRGAPCRVRTYRFCSFFAGLRYVFTPGGSLWQARGLRTYRFYLRLAPCAVWEV